MIRCRVHCREYNPLLTEYPMRMNMRAIRELTASLQGGGGGVLAGDVLTNFERYEFLKGC
ncbi:Hypothetical protein FKW44_000217 [Caligus rogercresseyi]|uniref:Uncharacterized protein n=1 Tax=Caligus rogercresseyi TaxID=217165 RepID=A0A7T8KH00_CALRO|nr:Hypothetical protein FKW44_000217 [Caligus rogercresseyi]